MRALSIAATGMLAQQLNVEVISNNLANMNTTGHKRQRAEFQDLLYQTIKRIGTDSSDAGTITPSGIQIGVGVKAGAVYRITQQGDLETTGNNYDVAINGNGFFRVQLPNGEDAYTRAGSFQLNDQGQLVTPDGYQVQPGITVPQEAIDVSINQQGVVYAKLSDQVELQQVGQIELAIFFNEAGLESVGGNLLLETPASGSPNTSVPGGPGYGHIMQGFLETSNVDAVREITSLISAQRAYELNSKVISSADEMMRTMSSMR